jgi:invasion protein IalB
MFVMCGLNNQALAQCVILNMLLALKRYWVLIILEVYLKDKDWNKITFVTMPDFLSETNLRGIR